MITLKSLEVPGRGNPVTLGPRVSILFEFSQVRADSANDLENAKMVLQLQAESFLATGKIF